MQTNPLSLFVFLCGIISAVNALSAWRYRSTRGSQMFSLFMVAVTIYVLAYSMELASGDLSVMLFWSKVGYLGIYSFPTLFLLFVLQYTGRERWLKRKYLLLLFIVPTLLLLAKFLDDKFHLVYSTTWVDNRGLIPLLGFTRGPLYPFALYSILPVGLGIFLLWRTKQNTHLLYRNQATLVFVSTIFPLVFFVFYMVGFRPPPGFEYLDLNALLYTFWGIGVGWAAFRYGLFELAPIARDALIERLSDGVLVLDDHGRLVDANPVAVKILGWSLAPIGQHAYQAFSEWIDLRDACLSTEDSNLVKTEIKYVRQGETSIFETNITSLLDHRGRSIGRLFVIRDITQRKKDEETRRESQEIFHTYFNMGSVGMCIMSPDRGWVEVNDLLCQMLGYSADELYRLTWSELTYPADLDDELNLFNDILCNKRDSYQLDKRFIRQDGQVVYTSVYISGYRNPGDAVCYFIASIVDITERKHSAEALLKLTAFEERQRLARDMHDSVNQSIHGLMLFSETLISTLEKGKTERSIQIAVRLQESARQALKETRLLLYQIQPPGDDRGKNFIHDLEVRLLTVERHAGVGVQIIQEGSLEYCPLEWFENLFWIILEALNNALKHAQARNSKITIRCFPENLQIEVMDDGIGFDPAINHIGGLGLNNMRERANLLGGELCIVSAPGKGSRVCFNSEIRNYKE